MKQINWYNKKSSVKHKMLLAFLSLSLVLVSCGEDNAIVEETAINSERVNLSITGTINDALNLESAELTTYAPKLKPIFNNEEYEFIVNLGNGAELYVTLYNMYMEQPLELYYDYDAYTTDIVLENDKPSYMIAQYITDGTDIQFSTIAENVNGIIQNGVLNVEDNGSYYRVFISGLNLYEDEGFLRTENSEVAIQINGTFTVIK